MVNKFAVEWVESSLWGIQSRVVEVDTGQTFALSDQKPPYEPDSLQIPVSVKRLNEVWYKGYKAALLQMGLKDVQ